MAYLQCRCIAKIEEIFPVTEISSPPLGLIGETKESFVLSGQALKGKLGKPSGWKQIGDAETRFFQTFASENRLIDERWVDERKLMGVK
jgi:hypothetical protein